MPPPRLAELPCTVESSTVTVAAFLTYKAPPCPAPSIAPPTPAEPPWAELLVRVLPEMWSVELGSVMMAPPRPAPPLAPAAPLPPVTELLSKVQLATVIVVNLLATAPPQ